MKNHLSAVAVWQQSVFTQCYMKTTTSYSIRLLAGVLLCSLFSAHAAESRLDSPDGRIALILSDNAGLHYRVELDSKPLLADSQLDLEFQDGARLGPTAPITQTQSARHNGIWENHHPEAKLSTIPPGKQNTLPLLVETPVAYVAIAEADLLDWAGMFTTGTSTPVVGLKLAPRQHYDGLVVSDAPRVAAIAPATCIATSAPRG